MFSRCVVFAMDIQLARFICIFTITMLLIYFIILYVFHSTTHSVVTLADDGGGGKGHKYGRYIRKVQKKITIPSSAITNDTDHIIVKDIYY